MGVATLVGAQLSVQETLAECRVYDLWLATRLSRW
jgi:hypothetical protein